MNTILLAVLVYVSYLFIWFVVNLIAYFIAIAFKKPVVIGVFVGLAVIVVQILNFGIGIGLLIYTISLLLDGQFLWFLVMIFIGIGLISGILGFLQMPFMLIPGYFAEKIEDMDLEEDTVVGEILDKDNKVVDISEGETSLKTRFAKYFLAIYALGLVNLIIFSVEREGLVPIDYITKPFFQIISLTLIIGIPYGIYRKIKHKAFFPKDKRYFLIQTWKISLYIFIPLLIIVYLLALGTNTL